MVAGLRRRSVGDARVPASVPVEECRSLIAVAKGALSEAVKHRRREIRRLRRLHRLAETPSQRDFILRKYSYDDLRDRLVLLAMLYRKHGKLDRAIATLAECKQFCDQHGVKFDSADLLEEYQENKRAMRHT